MSSRYLNASYVSFVVMALPRPTATVASKHRRGRSSLVIVQEKSEPLKDSTSARTSA